MREEEWMHGFGIGLDYEYTKYIDITYQVALACVPYVRICETRYPYEERFGSFS